MLFNVYEAYNTAISAEQAAWDDVRFRLPGTLNFDLELWKAWLDARRRTDVARERLMHVVLSRPVRPVAVRHESPW